MQNPIKILSATIVLVLTLSCEQKSSLQVGDCIQKPDSADVWKIKSSNPQDEKVKIVHIADPQKTMEVRTDESWIITSCQGFSPSN